jgi:hypothetical protein
LQRHSDNATLLHALLHSVSLLQRKITASDSYYSGNVGTVIASDSYRFSHLGPLIASDSYRSGNIGTVIAADNYPL